LNPSFRGGRRSHVSLSDIPTTSQQRPSCVLVAVCPRRRGWRGTSRNVRPCRHGGANGADPRMFACGSDSAIRFGRAARQLHPHQQTSPRQSSRRTRADAVGVRSLSVLGQNSRTVAAEHGGELCPHGDGGSAEGCRSAYARSSRPERWRFFTPSFWRPQFFSKKLKIRFRIRVFLRQIFRDFFGSLPGFEFFWQQEREFDF
jgi:hypothetical protein